MGVSVTDWFKSRERPPAIFVAKDGVLLEDVGDSVDIRRLALRPGAAHGLRMLHRSGYRIFVVADQPGLALGHYRPEALKRFAAHLKAALAVQGVPLAGLYHCPHHPDGSVEAYATSCLCRKPKPGLIQRAAREHGLDLAASWAIGDLLDHVEAGKRAGCRTALVDDGRETAWKLTHWRVPTRLASDLTDAAETILSASPVRADEDVLLEEDRGERREPAGGLWSSLFGNIFGGG